MQTMPVKTPYNVNDSLLHFAQVYTLFAFLFENNANIIKLCPNSLLYSTLPVAMIVYCYVWNISKLYTKLIVDVINCIVFFSCAIFILSQVCTICDGKLGHTFTYIAGILNSCIIVWFGCASLKKIIEKYGVNVPIAGIHYNSINMYG